MDIFRNILAVLTVLFAIGAATRTLRQCSSNLTTVAVLVSSLLGLLLLVGFACAAFFRSSWTLLGLGFALYGMVAALGFHLSMFLLSPSNRQHALLGLTRNLPWWSGVIVSLLRTEWLPLLIGIGISVLLYLVLPSGRGKAAPAAAPIGSEER